MSRQLPSTRSLQVFSAVARHQSVSLAAEELCLTHSALSQQLRKLEDQLGVKLFQRSPRGIALTEAGRYYREKVDDDLLRLESHALELMARREDESSLLIGAVPVFAERWLMPRLADFLALHPRINLHVKVFPNNLYMADPHYDAAIHYSNAVWPGARMQPLMQEECVAVCAPGTGFSRRIKSGDFRSVPLLHLTSRLTAWQDWFEQASVARAPPKPLAGHRFDLFSMLVEAVRGGAGIGLVPRFYVERELRGGELVLAHPHVLAASQTYAVFVPEHKSKDPIVAAFTQWVASQATPSGRLAP
ncbi:MAG TPA: LysR substrate-binding domain-containing protein [Burkholderiaceae bacterium]|nr:LysR substrate-binding domain-containing protein [Burkholderiaceae bacterium]